jgi:hypothetical protein
MALLLYTRDATRRNAPDFLVEEEEEDHLFFFFNGWIGRSPDSSQSGPQIPELLAQLARLQSFPAARERPWVGQDLTNKKKKSLPLLFCCQPAGAGQAERHHHRSLRCVSKQANKPTWSFFII